MTDFTVFHGPLQQVNSEFVQAVGTMRNILDALNGVLKNTANATQGQALPLWEGRQQRWEALYAETNGKLGSHANNSDEIAYLMQHGDYRGAQALQGS